MTRKSRREIERAVEDLDAGDGADDGEDTFTVILRRDRVDQDGELVEENRERVEVPRRV